MWYLLRERFTFSIGVILYEYYRDVVVMVTYRNESSFQQTEQSLAGIVLAD